MNSEEQKKLAVLIDADNASAGLAQELFEEIAKYGIASVKRIYGDWSSPTLKGWKDILLKHALVPVQQFAYTKGKDATDMGLIIDAMDLLYSSTFDGFCLVSSDSDFTPLASRIRASGLTVYGFGKNITPEAFRQSCDRFFYIENFGSEPCLQIYTNGDGDLKDNSIKKQQKIEGQLRNILYKAIKDSAEEDTGWASVSKIGIYLSQTQPDFDPRSHGYAKLSGMLKALGGLQFRYDESTRMYCRKVPYLELRAIINEAMPKFQNKQGWAKINAMEKYIKPRWSYLEYGFESFPAFLETVKYVEIKGDAMRVVPQLNGDNKTE